MNRTPVTLPPSVLLPPSPMHPPSPMYPPAMSPAFPLSPPETPQQRPYGNQSPMSGHSYNQEIEQLRKEKETMLANARILMNEAKASKEKVADCEKLVKEWQKYAEAVIKEKDCQLEDLMKKFEAEKNKNHCDKTNLEAIINQQHCEIEVLKTKLENVPFY